MPLEMLQTQKQILAPALLQSSKILQMGVVELRQYIHDLACENVAVELEFAAMDEGCGLSADVQRYFESPLGVRRRDDEDDPSLPEFSRRGAQAAPCLQDELRGQLLAVRYAGRDPKVLEYILESLDENGFLPYDAAQIAAECHVSRAAAAQCLHAVQSLEPAGVAARNVTECLLLQLRRLAPHDEVARQVVCFHMDALAKDRCHAIARTLQVPKARVQEAAELIRRLNPKPANGYRGRESTHYIIPDILVVKTEEGLAAVLNDRLLPKLRISAYYRQLMKTTDDAEARSYLQEKLAQAAAAYRFIQKRGHTLQRVMDYILLRQARFFTEGAEHLRTMRMAGMAAELSLHESTVSRTVSGKYFQCAWGVFALRGMFSHGVKDPATGEEVDHGRIHVRLRELVAGEPGDAPHSDQRLCQLLEADGLPVSRRTVAKYRMLLGIPNAFQRRRSP